jgi:putative heme-binding domain-containing protein
MASGALMAQHTFSPADIEDGGRFYQNTCAGCHGPEGDQVKGIDLLRGKFRKTYSDDDLVKIIENGIPGTAMTPSNLTGLRAETVVAYLRSQATLALRPPAATGDPGRGKTIFEGKGGCLNCHRVGEKGSRTGPDLSEIGSMRRDAQLEQSLLDPDADVAPLNRSYRVVTKDGATITGRLLNQDTFTVQILDSQEQLRSFSKANLREYALLDKSPMPSYRTRLTTQELGDVVSYLSTLKTVRP